MSIQGKSCRAFLEFPTGEVPDFVRRTALRLSRLQKDRQVTVILTWPAVAGTDCYDFAEVDPYVAKLRKIFMDAGIAVVGDPRSSRFPEEHILDTYYHIDIAAAYARTRRLVEDIRAAGLLSADQEKISPPLAEGSAALIETAFIKEEARIAQNNSTLLSPLSTGAYAVGTQEFENFFQFSPRGWHAFENWGVWSRDDNSEIALRPRPDKTCEVNLDRLYFSQARPSLISLDGKFVKIDDDGPISIAPGDRPITIGLQHRDVHSPSELGGSDDRRRLAFGLKGITVSCE